MILKEQLLGNDVKKKVGFMILATEAAQSESVFSELMECFFSTDYRLAQRAAWVVSHVIALNQKLISPYLKRMAGQLLQATTPVAVVRNTLRIFRIIEIPEDVQGALMNTCFILAEKADTPAAIKAFSLHLLQRLSALYPDIADEVRTIAEENQLNKKAAVKSVAKKIVNHYTKAKPQV